ncbi:MAG: ABC transporter permease [Oligoflexia bacterium]|nr:ABC transporter permease [Oligoflexia bacterium]
MFENLRHISRYRALISALVVRHLSIRYRGSVLGFLWSFLNPLCLMLVYTLVFRHYIRFNGVPNYTIFLFCGLLPWIWLSSALLEGTNAIVASGHLITKSMFPALILPLVAVLTTMVNFVLSLPLLFVFVWLAGLEFHLTMLLIPLAIILQCLFVFGVTLATSTLNVRFRDVQHLLANALTLLFFLCPVVYPVESVPERWRFTLDLNPLALFVRSYQQLILDGTIPNMETIGYLGLWALGMLALGNILYSRYHESFAEML